MKNLCNLALFGLVLVSCGLGAPDTSEVVAPIGETAVTTDASSYFTDQNISVTYAGLPGNVTDWVAIAPAGSDVATVTIWAYTGGSTSGTHVFGGVSPSGSYVARTFSEDSYTMVGESVPFTTSDPVVNTGATLATTAPSYQTGEAIVANWTGLPGTPTDWIAIAPPGSDAMTVTAWAYTGGAASGTHSFTGLSTVGSYVVRVFPTESYSVAAEAAFSVVAPSGATVTTDASVYGVGMQLTVTYSGLPGNATDWIALAPKDSPITSVVRWAYTGGQTSGTMTFEVPLGAAFVARAFVNDSYSELGESAPFTVDAGSVTTDHSTYATTDQVVVTWQSLPGNPNDWIALAPSGSPVTTVTAWIYASGAVAGTHTFAALAAGSYVARAFLDDTYKTISESPVFVVAPANFSVTTDATTYATGADITVTWTNLPGNLHDWIAIAPSGSSDTNATWWVYTNGATAGSTTFYGGLASTGNYVARAFADDTYVKLGESAAFDVQ